ncbi:MAG: tetratricopeptide repeat protein [Planctomycetaceae bacterium]
MPSRQSERDQPAERDQQTVWIGLILAAFTVAAYWGVWTCGFVNFDDQIYVYENPRVTTGLSLANIQWALTTGECANWHPLTWLSLMLDATLFGPGPRGFHATNLGWHVANVLLLFCVLKQFTRQVGRSAFVAALFAVHPVHVESVAWISERKDVLSLFFGLLALWTYGSFVRTGRVRWYVGAIVSFGCSLMSKPMLVTLPCLLLLLDVWPLARFKGSAQRSPDEFTAQPIEQFGALRLILEKLPFVVLTILSCVVTLQVQRAGGALDLHVALSDRLANAVLAYGWYLKMLFVPKDLSVFYPHPTVRLAWSVVAASAVGLTVMTMLAIGLWKRAPFVRTGWFWFLGLLVPVIGIIQVGTQQRADRYLYLPAVGIYLLVVWSGAIVVSRIVPLRRAVTFLMVVMLAWLAIRTQIQTRVWRNSVTLWSNALRVSGGDARSRTQLAQSYQRAGDREQARIHYQEAFKLIPSEPHLNVNYGLFLVQEDQFAAAIPHFQLALKRAPQDSRAMGFLGFALWSSGDLDQAELWLRRAMVEDPTWSRPFYWFGQMRLDQKRYDEAVELLRQAVQADPLWKQARKELARAEQLQREQTGQP